MTELFFGAEPLTAVNEVEDCRRAVRQLSFLTVIVTIAAAIAVVAVIAATSSW
jgi:hypothetical protein